MSNNIGLIRIADNFSTMSCNVTTMQEEIQKLTEAIATLNNRIDELQGTRSDLRPVADAITDIPNQKYDLEIFNQIIPNEDFLIFGDIGWSLDIMDLDKTNMFLN